MKSQFLPPAPPAWRPAHLLLAPHRLGFFLGSLLLAAASLWWAWVQGSRLGLLPGPVHAVAPTTLHSALMVFGFFPLFFFGFLFTAGPKWLAVQAPGARAVAVPLLLQAGGWLAWLAGGHAHLPTAVLGLALAACGLAAGAWRFAALVRQSRAPDRIHAKAITLAMAFGVLCLAALVPAVLSGAGSLQRALVLGGLWGFVVAVYVTVVHRMVPFFTSSALPFVLAWRPFWVLWSLLGLAAFEALAAMAESFGWQAPAWLLLRGGVEFVAGGGVLALAIAWGLVQSLKVRLLGMLHLGFTWLSVALLLAGASHLLQGLGGAALLPLAPLHALGMGCLGSLLLAMVTRVAAGHSGRPLVADAVTWTLFCLLQVATVLRIAGALPAASSQVLLLLAAGLWAAVVLAWSLRLGGWYGRIRADGRPG